MRVVIYTNLNSRHPVHYNAAGYKIIKNSRNKDDDHNHNNNNNNIEHNIVSLPGHYDHLFKARGTLRCSANRVLFIYHFIIIFGDLRLCGRARI